jgi:zinc transport system substrate-binding protein
MLLKNKKKICTRHSVLRVAFPRSMVGLFGLGLIGVILVGCFQGGEETRQEKKENPDREIRIVAVSYPLQYLTQRIVGDLIDVEYPVPQEVDDPSQWRPTRASVLAMQSAELVIANGAGADYAKWLPKVSLPESKLCRIATKGLSLSDYIAVEDVSMVHSHGPEGEHSHPTMVSRTWLDPAIAKKQAAYISELLTKQYPQFAATLEANLTVLSKDLDRLTALLEPTTGQQIGPLVTATPLQKFFTRAAGAGDLHLTWFEVPDVEQAGADLKALLKGTDAAGGVVVFDQELPSDEILALIDDQGFSSLALNLIDQPPANGDFLSSLESNIVALKAALGGQK